MISFAMLMREKLKTRQHTGERKAEVKKAREAARVTLQSSSVWWSRVPASATWILSPISAPIVRRAQVILNFHFA